jgi:hypothetical protein
LPFLPVQREGRIKNGIKVKSKRNPIREYKIITLILEKKTIYKNIEITIKNNPSKNAHKYNKSTVSFIPILYMYSGLLKLGFVGNFFINA